MKIVHCINARAFGDPRDLRRLVEADGAPESVALGTVVGVVDALDVCAMVTGGGGEFIEFKGAFRMLPAVVNAAGEAALEAVESDRCILPASAVANMIYSGLVPLCNEVPDAARKGDKVRLLRRLVLKGGQAEFAVRVGVEAAPKSATGYTWTADIMTAPKADNPLDRLARQITG